MANHNLTDLLPNWHLLPAGGGRILKDERYVIVDEDGRSISIFTSDADWTAIADRRVLTEHLVPPPLPTEEGSTILASDDCRRPRILLTLEAGQWVSGLGLHWNVEQLRAWCPVTLGETVVMR